MDSFCYHPAAITDLKCHDNVYTTGCFDKTVRIFDPRSQSVVLQSLHHKRAIVCLEVYDKFILSGSEDKTIGIYDVRAGKLLTRLSTDTPILCMNIAQEQGFNYLRVGGREGSFYLFDITNDRFTLLNSSQLWEDYKVTSLCNYYGGLVACSQSGVVRMYTPGRKSTLIEKFETHTGDVASAHSRKGLLVTGSSDNSATVWNFVT